jgi:hypothetical protein
MFTSKGSFLGLPNLEFTCAAGLDRVSFGIYSIGNQASVAHAEQFVAGTFNKVLAYEFGVIGPLVL